MGPFRLLSPSKSFEKFETFDQNGITKHLPERVRSDFGVGCGDLQAAAGDSLLKFNFLTSVDQAACITRFALPRKNETHG